MYVIKASEDVESTGGPSKWKVAQKAFGRVLSLKKKDNVESQGGPSNQKSKGNVPKNSSTIKKPESHKKSAKEVESDYGSEFFNKFEDDEPPMQTKHAIVPGQNMTSNNRNMPQNMPGGMNQTNTNRGAPNSNFRLTNPRSSNPPSKPPMIRPNNQTQQMPPKMLNNGIGGGINNPNFGNRMNNSIPSPHNPQLGGHSQVGGNNYLNSHNGPQPGYGLHPQDPSMLDNHGFASGYGFNSNGGYIASMPPNFPNSNQGIGGMNNFDFGTGQQTFPPQQMVPHQHAAPPKNQAVARSSSMRIPNRSVPPNMRDGMKQTSIGTSRQIRPTKKQPSGANIEPVTTNMPVGRNNANSRGTHNSTRQINPPTMQANVPVRNPGMVGTYNSNSGNQMINQIPTESSQFGGNNNWNPQMSVPQSGYPSMPPQMPTQQPMIPYTGHDINNPGYTPQPARDDYAGSHEPGPKGYCAISGKPLYDTPPQP
uniref:Uncharacterized protein n=1 Tax=Meloidogyne floridensis TaxID=298350 RepID=A0A915PF97_9BILA